MKPWLLLALAAGLLCGQTKVDLKSQSKNIDFSGAVSVKPIPVGTVLPVSCSAGELFFKSNATSGENVYGCVATNTWAAQSNGSPVINGFSDLQASLAGAVLTIGQGRVNFVVNGVPVVLTLGPATIAKTSGTDTGTFLIYADYNAGAPTLRCAAGAGLNIGNYAVSSGFSGSTCGSGSAFPAYSVPLAIVDVSGGTIQTPQDMRSALSRDPVIAGSGLTMTGNVLSLGNGVGTGGVKRVAFSALPSCTAAEAGTQYLFTDGAGLTAHCNGASFAYFYNGQAVTLPGQVSGYTKVNASGGRDVTDDQGGLYVHAVSSAGENLVTALKGLAGATDIRAAVVFGSGGADANVCGLVLTDGTASSSKATLFGRQAQTNAWVTETLNYSSYTAVAADTARAAASSSAPLWLRMTIASGNHNFYTSADAGRTWEQVGSQVEYEVATHYGIGCDARGTATGAAMLVVSLTAQ